MEEQVRRILYKVHGEQLSLVRFPFSLCSSAVNILMNKDHWFYKTIILYKSKKSTKHLAFFNQYYQQFSFFIVFVECS